MESIFNYEEAVKYIDEIPKFTKKNTLEHTKAFLEGLKINQNKMKIIHVAGTNGKGSVCAMISNVLSKAEKKTGLFTSPHLVKVNERVKINNEMISDEAFTEAFNIVKNKVTEMESKGYPHPSYFEFLFLLAMNIFDKENVDYVVLETGLGGRLDATNSILNPLITVITSIGLDHMEYLGDTVEDIAGEKAGIIKENIPVVFWAENEEVCKVIEGKAIQKKAPTYPINYSYCKNIIKTDKSVDFCIQSGYYLGCDFSIPFISDYQVANALIAINAIGIVFEKDDIKKDLSEKLTDKEFEEIVLKQGLKSVKWEGRMENVFEGVFLDGAHNGPGIDEFIKTFNEYKCNGKKKILFSVVKDKDYDYMVSQISKTEVSVVYVTGIDSDRGLDVSEIKKDFEKNNCKAKVENFDNAKVAFSKALIDRKEEDVLFCVGSLYLIGEIKKYINERYTQ
ncbi:MAG: bifunctional folylpolyglutamate synthase/dihydrofolate synthase [Lachnospiraceae bacterium]|nr:bifunctional folylpolyglutamate synthase/dihydrofolate synthase [Lachnospiraceae bacterium]